MCLSMTEGSISMLKMFQLSSHKAEIASFLILFYICDVWGSRWGSNGSTFRKDLTHTGVVAAPVYYVSERKPLVPTVDPVR